MSESTRTTGNPYPGLRPFDQDDKDVFFGRQSETTELVRRLEAVRFLAIVGPPGSGKSSLVRAGLLPALADEGLQGATRILALRPGPGLMNQLARELVQAFPSANILESQSVRQDKLAQELREGSRGFADTVRGSGQPDEGSCLIFVDQFEELFYRGDLEENAVFVRMLLEVHQDAAIPVRVLATLGSDFLGDCSCFKGLQDAVTRGLYLMAEPGEEQLREMIEGPARVSGARIAPEVVDRILRDVDQEQEPLPSLQYVLHRSWNSRASVDLAEYDSLGGLAEAIPADAERVMGELSDDERRLARRLFQCITYKLPHHRCISWPTPLEEIARLTGASEASLRAVIERFRATTPGFLAPMASETIAPDSWIAISHDSLIRKWRTLQDWVDEEHDAANLYRALVRSAERHAEGRGELWRGPALDLAAQKVERKEWGPEWARRLGGNYYAAINFLEESLRTRAASTASRDVSRPLNAARIAGGVFGLLFVASLGVLIYFYEREREAVAQQQKAEQLLSEARRERVAAMQGLSRANLEKGEADRRRGAAIRQKQIAERQQKIAESRLRIAETQQRIAESQSGYGKAPDDSARQLLYVANMNLAHRAFEEGDYVRGQEFLEQYLHSPASGPADSPDDVRSFFWYYLWRENHDEIATLRGHEKTVSTAAFSSDGSLLATGSRDGTVKLWDPVERKMLDTWDAGGHAVSAVAFSPDGTLVAAASRDGSVRLWDAKSRQEVATIVAHRGYVLAIAFTRDGGHLIVGGKDGHLSLWDVDTHTKLATLDGHQRDIYAVVVSPDGRTLATGSQDDTVKLWNLETRNEVATLEGDGDDVYAAAFSPDGSLLATGYKNGFVKVWEVESREEVSTLGGEHEGDVYSVGFSPNGEVLAAGRRNGTLELWNVATQERLEVLKGHGDSVMSATFAPETFAPEGMRLVSGSRDGTAKLWGLDRGKTRATLSGDTPVFAIAFEPGSRRLAAGSVDDTVRLWDLRSREESMTLKGAGDVLFAVAFSPNGELLATGSKDGTVKVWNVSSGEESRVLKGHKDVVFSVAFSPDGRTLATGSWDHTVKLWHVPNGAEPRTLEGHDDAVFSVAFSTDGKVIATGSKDTTVRLWDAETGEELAELRGHADAVFPVAFSPDGAILATASRDGVVKLWHVETREEAGTLRGHTDSVSSIAFSPDGRVLATGSLDDSVKLWDVETRRELATLSGHAKDVYAVAFSADGRLLGTGSLDGTVKLWERAVEAEVAAQR